MNRVARLWPQAEHDLKNAYDWYESESSGLGKVFVDHAQAVFERIADRPLIYPEVCYDARRALLRRFPYFVIYRKIADDVHIIAIMHVARDPNAWQSRI